MLNLYVTTKSGKTHTTRIKNSDFQKRLSKKQV